MVLHLDRTAGLETSGLLPGEAYDWRKKLPPTRPRQRECPGTASSQPDSSRSMTLRPPLKRRHMTCPARKDSAREWPEHRHLPVRWRCSEFRGQSPPEVCPSIRDVTLIGPRPTRVYPRNNYRDLRLYDGQQ